MAIRSNHGAWLPPGQTVRYNKWRKFIRVFSDGTDEVRYIRPLIFGKRHATQYWQITTDTDTLPENSTWWVMTRVPGIKYNQVGNLYGLRNWVEYRVQLSPAGNRRESLHSLKQSKNELGWADFRVTDYAQIEKWWSVVMSAYLLVSLHAKVINNSEKFNNHEVIDSAVDKFSAHDWWDAGQGWKNILNNLRLVIQPWVFFNLIKRKVRKCFQSPTYPWDFLD